MDAVDGGDVNMLNYFKENNIPHTYQCSKCGLWMGDNSRPECTHRWVIRDLRSFQKEGTNEPGNRDYSLPGGTPDIKVHPTLPGQGTGNLGPEFE